jgi:molybdopterin converting factor small subunit
MNVHSSRTQLISLVAAGSLSIGGLASIPAVHAQTQSHQPVAAQTAGTTISVTLRSWPAQRPAGGVKPVQIAYYPGVTPAAIAAAAGIDGNAISSLMAVVDDRQVDLTAPLAAGDRLELITGMAGG